MEFQPFPKIPRLVRDVVITEKIDGTNASVWVDLEGQQPVILAGSRTRFITTEQDNFGFARWVEENKEELLKLGHGVHAGEWWGQGIQRGYGLKNKVFSLFNTSIWGDDNVRPRCCSVVPVLYIGPFSTQATEEALSQLNKFGSSASPGYNKPEGIVIYHTAAKLYFKQTIEKDE